MLTIEKQLFDKFYAGKFNTTAWRNISVMFNDSIARASYTRTATYSYSHPNSNSMVSNGSGGTPAEVAHCQTVVYKFQNGNLMIERNHQTLSFSGSPISFVKDDEGNLLDAPALIAERSEFIFPSTDVIDTKVLKSMMRAMFKHAGPNESSSQDIAVHGNKMTDYAGLFNRPTVDASELIQRVTDLKEYRGMAGREIINLFSQYLAIDGSDIDNLLEFRNVDEAVAIARTSL